MSEMKKYKKTSQTTSKWNQIQSQISVETPVGFYDFEQMFWKIIINIQ